MTAAPQAAILEVSCLFIAPKRNRAVRVTAGCLSAILLAIVCLLPPNFSTQEVPSPFLDATASSGIQFKHQRGASDKKHLIETMGSGCAFLDYDSDGLLDILLINGGATPDSPPVVLHGHALYRNLGHGEFKDVTAQSGIKGNGAYGTGVAVGDYDNDGYPDVYITNFGPNILYHNNGDGTFSDVTETAGVGDPGWSSSAAFFDFDNDGYLDLYVANYVSYRYDANPDCTERNIRSYCHPRFFRDVPGKLYRNLGNGRFQDVSESSGIAHLAGKSLGVVAADFDGDGWMDLYVTNDTTRNFLLKNNGDGTFSDVTLMSGTGYNAEGEAEASMGVDAGDYDGDGLLDLVVTNYDLETNALYHNEGKFQFNDQRWPSGVAKADHRFLGFGTGFIDFDNDGDLDLFIVNGHVLDNIEQLREGFTYAQPNQLLENRGGTFFENLEFLRYSSLSPKVGRGAAFGDVDNDGDLDVLISNSGQEPTLLLNQVGKKRNWVLLKLIGTRSNRDAVGAKITVTTENLSQTDQITGGGSYLSASDLRAHFGLGNAEMIKTLKIRWPSGAEDVFRDIKANQILSIREGTPNSGAKISSGILPPVKAKE
ncbi:MAG: CRTAC1 family protein [Terriglobia bacterium]